jgi:tRNA (guanine-N7-)-methyltransferase
MDDRNHGPDLRSYGRRRGRAPSARQKALWQDVLPRVALPRNGEALRSLPGLFTPPAREVWLEIGFGGGEHLVCQAKANPDVGCIGCEPFEDGVVKVLNAIDAERIANVRVHADDARPLLRLLPAASVARIFVLFPDPWPKARHHKRRLISPATVAELARIGVPGAELRIATDIAAYARSILLTLQQEGSFRWTAACASDWRTRTPDWPQTRYEAKALREGRRCYYVRFRRA